jgi:hypothetical protein
MTNRSPPAPAIAPPDAPFWQAMSPAHPTAHFWTHVGMYSYQSACGMTAQRAPSGKYDGRHCERCYAALAQNDEPPPSSVGAPAMLADSAPAALSADLQDCARRYVAARERAGAALLEMAAALHQARQFAQHGQWYLFLQAIGTSEDQADRLLDIHAQAAQNPAYAEAVQRNFLNLTTAALLARSSTPPGGRAGAQPAEAAEQAPGRAVGPGGTRSRAQNPHRCGFCAGVPAVASRRLRALWGSCHTVCQCSRHQGTSL